MSEFERVAPQAVRHRDGFVVQIADRYHVEYRDGEFTARIDADLEGPEVVIHAKTLWCASPETGDALGPEVDVPRIAAGLQAMGETTIVED